MSAATLSPFAAAKDRIQFRRIHGYRRAFVLAGQGPALLFIHGIGDSAAAWSELIPNLARDHTVIVPDLLGHGRSDKPRADYSVAAYANAMRDLLTVVGVERATVVGHSLGGSVALQLAYQYPERCERLVLVAPGGIARDVHAVLRMVSSPIAEVVLPLLRWPAFHAVGRGILRMLHWLDTDIGCDREAIERALTGLVDATAQHAFVRTVRCVIDHRGQAANLIDRSYLAHNVPTLLVWGTRDVIVPYAHARIAQRAMTGSRLEVFEGAGHFPHHHDPSRFLDVLRHFLVTTRPAQHNPADWRELLCRERCADETSPAGEPCASVADATPKYAAG